jgi:ribosome biogenesis GTPase A
MHKNNEKAQKQIHFMMEQLDLVDSFRELNPHIKRYIRNKIDTPLLLLD